MWGSVEAFWAYRSNQIIFQSSLVSRHVKRLYQMLSLSVSVIQMRVHLRLWKITRSDFENLIKVLVTYFNFNERFDMRKEENREL